MRKRICLIRLIRLILHKYWDIKMLNTHCDVLLETSLNGSWKPRRQTLRRCYARHVETWHEIGQASNVLTCLEDMSWILDMCEFVNIFDSACHLKLIWSYLRMTHDVFFFICLSGLSFVNLSLRKKIWLSMVILASDLHATPWHRPLVAIFPRSYVALAEAKDTSATLRTLDSSGPKKSKRVDQGWWRMMKDDCLDHETSQR